jgi:hypothetical protein
MKAYIGAWTLAVLTGSSQFAFGAEITGKVKLKGTPPPERTIEITGAHEATCGKIHPKDKPVKTRHYVVSPDKGLANVFVYLKEGAKPAPAKGESPLLDQIGCLYEPYVLGAVAGQKIKIRNSDDFLHNVHATPKKNPEFNFAQVVKGQVNEKAFEKPEVLVRMKCDVHEWMFAYIGVVEHPYFAVTDKDGSFKITDVPAGDYTIEAFHLKAGAKTEKVKLGDSDKKTADFELEVPAAP